MRASQSTPSLESTIAWLTPLMGSATDKGGHPAIGHPIRIQHRLRDWGADEETQQIGLLHDVLEDGYATPETLALLGYSQRIQTGVHWLSRPKALTYRAYIKQLATKGGPDALLTKLADLTDNLNLSRLQTITAKDIQRVEKRYLPAYETIWLAYEPYQTLGWPSVPRTLPDRLHQLADAKKDLT